MISLVYIRRISDNPEADILLKRLHSEGFYNLRKVNIEKVYRLEGITGKQTFLLKPLLCHSFAETMSESSALRDEDGPIFEVGYQRAVTDPELPSVLHGAAALGINELEWVRIAHRYQFVGIDRKTAEMIVKRYLYNPQVQVIINADEEWKTLKPQGEAGPVEHVSLKSLSDDRMLMLSEERRLFLNLEQMRELQKISAEIGRDFTDGELEMFAQTWSDHCFHTTWKSLGLLQHLWETTKEIDHPLVVSVFEDNAGAFEFYQGWALTIKGETHNSPTAISPYGGIMTKHGGVIRDTLGCGQGAKPIGGTTVMGLGDPLIEWSDVPKGCIHPKTILADSIRGTADYNNPMGIPMMFPVYKFHKGYTGKCFALGHSIGIIPLNRARKGHPRPGDFAVLIGGLTGRDGIHGATVSSGSMTSRTAEVDSAHVQIGHPIEERKFMDAIPVLRDRDCIRAITDLGAAGLSSAAGEMGAETGVWINLAWVPLKTEGMHPWEIWISESQERMLLCVPPEKIKETFAILDDYETRATIIGKFTDTKKCQVVFDDSDDLDPHRLGARPELTGEILVDIEFKYLRKRCPLPPVSIRDTKIKRVAETIDKPNSKEELISSIKAVIGHLNICDQSPAGFQFDSTVQGITVIGPYGGIDGRMPNDIWVSAPLRGKPFGAVASIGFNPLYGDVDPEGMSRLVIVEATTKLVAAGVSPSDIVLCDNFYTPRVNEKVAGILKGMVYACCEVSKDLGIPFISGKDSSSGTFIDERGRRLDIPPTLAVMALGRVSDVNRLVTKPWKKAGNRLMVAGPLTSHLGGSIYLDTLSKRGDRLPEVNTDRIKSFWKRLAKINLQNKIKSVSAISEGGIIRRLFEMALGSQMGCRINLSAISDSMGLKDQHIALFAEMIGAILFEIDEKSEIEFAEEIESVAVGEIIPERVFIIETEDFSLNIPFSELLEAWEKPFRELLG